VKNKIKAISFLPQFIPLIKQGKKTVTRRIKTNLEIRNIVYFKAGRLGEKEGYIIIKSIKLEPLKEITYWYGKDEPIREGVGNLREFLDLWNALNGDWRNNPMIYRIEFEYLGESLND